MVGQSQKCIWDVPLDTCTVAKAKTYHAQNNPNIKYMYTVYIATACTCTWCRAIDFPLCQIPFWLANSCFRFWLYLHNCRQTCMSAKNMCIFERTLVWYVSHAYEWQVYLRHVMQTFWYPLKVALQCMLLPHLRTGHIIFCTVCFCTAVTSPTLGIQH